MWANRHLLTMTLKCTLFGHRYGEPAVERDRDEEGSEVVSTIREIETCVRCGESRVVSENTEVTTLETPEEPASPSDGAEADDGRAASTEGGVEALVRSAESADAVATSDEADGDDHADAAEDDGVILEEPNEDEEREPGAWPEEPTRETDDRQPIEPGADDRDSGAWPEEPEPEGPEWAPSTDRPDPDADEADVEPTGGAVTVPRGTYHCPECGFTTPVESSSLRQGDFCPECHTGSLAHRPEDA